MVIYLTEAREKKILSIFKDQNEKYGINLLPSTKIAALCGMNAYTCKECLKEMQAQGKAELVEINTKENWRLK